MATGATGQLGLALPVQGELSGTWGDTVNNGITQYTNIAIAATLTLTDDGAVTLSNTTGDASASNITSTLTGAGTVTAQFAIVRVTGTLTTAKVVTAPSYSKTYTVVNAATGGIVTFKAAGQTGVSIAVGESAFVYFNGTDYVKVSSSVTAGTIAIANGGTGQTTATAAFNALSPVTSTGDLILGNGSNSSTRLAIGASTHVLTSNGTTATWAANPLGTVTTVGWTGGIVTVTNPTTTPAFTIAGTAGGIPYFSSGTAWATSAALTANALVIGGGAGAAPSTTTTGAGILTFLGTPSSANLAAAVTGETGSGALVFATAPSLSGVVLNDGYTEEVYAVVDAAGVAISPTNGSIQTWTLGASRTPTAGTWAAGQSITLMIDDGTAYTVTWTTLAVTWVGGSAPTLATTGFTVIQLWKVGSTIYGALTGSVA